MFPKRIEEEQYVKRYQNHNAAVLHDTSTHLMNSTKTSFSNLFTNFQITVRDEQVLKVGHVKVRCDVGQRDLHTDVAHVWMDACMYVHIS